MFLTGVWYLDLDLDMVTGIWYTHDPNFGSLPWFWRCKEHPCPLSHHLGLWRTLEVPDWGSASWSWFEYDHWSLIHPWYKFWLSILILKVEVTSMYFKSWFGAFADAGCFWLGFGILILIWIWSWVFDLALAFGLGSGFWLWHWFLHSSVEKICWPGFGWVRVGSGGWVRLKIKISQS